MSFSVNPLAKLSSPRLAALNRNRFNSATGQPLPYSRGSGEPRCLNPSRARKGAVAKMKQIT